MIPPATKPSTAHRPPTQNSPTRETVRLVRVILAGLAIWGILMTAAVIWFSPQLDWRKPVLVSAWLSLFVGGWIVLLISRRKRLAAGNTDTRDTHVTSSK